MGFLAKALASGFGLGLLPKAPGTWGSLGGLGIAYLWTYYNLSLWYGCFLLTGIAYFSIGAAEKEWGEDDQRIVVDEVAGQFLAVAYFPPDITLYSFGFFLFRVLDITKIGPIGYAEKHAPKTWNTLLDDLIAGSMTGCLVWAISWGKTYLTQG